MKYFLLIMLNLFFVGCYSNSHDSSVTEEEINNYQDEINLQLLQDLNSKISINTISGFEIIDIPKQDNLILSAFNKDKDISLSAFDFGKINKNKQNYFNDLKDKLKSQDIKFIDKKDLIMYKLQFKEGKNNINEVCFTIFDKENNLYSICVNSKLLSLDELENSVKKIQF